jgi:hypothetical protein
MSGLEASIALARSVVDGGPKTSLRPKHSTVASPPISPVACPVTGVGPHLWVHKQFVDWIGVRYLRTCPKCGSVVIVDGAWQLVTRMRPEDHDYVYGHCRKSGTCRWKGELPRVALDQTVAK